MSKVTIGVIGAGLIGRKHLRKLSEQADYDLVGIADVNAGAVAAEYPRTRIFADYRKLLDETRPQAVIIASPNQLHAETGIECARRGIHILIEKPVTDTLQTAAALMAEVRKGGIKSLVGHHRRHHSQVRTLKALLGEGQIGDIVGVSAIWATHKPADYFKIAPWRTEPGGGPILLNLIHVGTPEDVVASLRADSTLERVTDLVFQVHSVDPPHPFILRSIELVAEKVAPALGWSKRTATEAALAE